MARAGLTARIDRISGDAQVRYGLSEAWNPAVAGIVLREIDTILTGETGSVTLILEDGREFVLGPNCILDIGDLRQIVEDELFLFLMSEKVSTLPRATEKRKIRIGNVSSPHAGKIDIDSSAVNSDSAAAGSWFEREVNGARALYDQAYYSNAVIKMHKLIQKYSPLRDCSQVYIYMARAFEFLKMPGQAADTYQAILDLYSTEANYNKEIAERTTIARQAIERLKSNR